LVASAVVAAARQRDVRGSLPVAAVVAAAAVAAAQQCDGGGRLAVAS